MTESIAITGIGLRFPPACDQPEAFWKFLLDGGDAIRPVPPDRWDPRRFQDDDADRPGKTYVAKGGFLRQDVRTFDPMVFGISPREARGIDPQQRLLLETAWEAFEDAGVAVESLEDTRTGVFLGGFCLDHLLHIAQPANRLLAGSHSATSASMTILANRLSYAFNLRGPSFTLDTACSSSLVALHCACRAILSGECDAALAGGSNVMMRPEYPVMMSKGQFLSRHGNCRAFDASAGGYVRGEGAGILFLKPLEKALADGDDVYAVVRATGVNQDGRTSGISLPNSEAQEELMKEVYASAGIDPAEVDYVEAHGTGTQAGDPAEARALDAVFGTGRPSERPLLVGSVKTNIGHLEAAAGVAGVIKAALVLKHRLIPRNLHFNNPNPKIPFDAYRLKVVAENHELAPDPEGPALLAGVNSFGYGGTNAHAVLSSPPPIVPRGEAAGDDGGGAVHLYPLAARSAEALRETASRLAFLVRRNKSMGMADLRHTLARRRSHAGYRAVVLAADRAELRTGLMAASSGEESASVRIGAEAAARRARPVFVCTGMGPQWWAMGRELFETQPVCREALEEIDAIFAPMAGWSIREEMLKDEASSRMARTEVAQPANFALQVALARLWRQWGIEPGAIIGHSVGEVASAYLAGVYSLEDAVSVSFHRSRLQQGEAGKGAMLAVGLSEEAAEGYLEQVEGVSVAAVNSFASVTLSGDAKGLEVIAARLEAEGVFHKALRVEVAYHSPQMDPIREELLGALAGLDPRPAQVPLVSTVSGAFSDGSEWTADYWWNNVRRPVRFALGIETLLKEGNAIFLEVGPHPVLGNSIKEVAAGEGASVRCHPSLRRKEPEMAGLRAGLADLFASGVDPDWDALGASGGRFVRLPKYPWQRQPYWNEPEASQMYRVGLPGPVYLNQRLPGPRPAWEVEINRNFFPFLPDHGIQDQTVFPGMGYVEAALSLGLSENGGGTAVLGDVDFEKFLIVDPARIQNLVSSLDPETGFFEIGSREEGGDWEGQRHAKGRLTVRAGAEEAPRFDLEECRAQCPKPLPLDALYEKLSRRGLHYGPAFRPIRSLRTGGNCFFAELETDDGDRNAGGHCMHPTILDACLQPLLYIARKDRLFVPNGMRRMRFYGARGSRFTAFGRLLRQTDTSLVGQVWIADPEGRAVAVIEEMTCQAVDTEGSAAELTAAYVPSWSGEEPDEARPAVSKEDAFAVVGDERFTDPELQAALADGNGAERMIGPDTDPQELREWLGGALPGGGRVLATIGTRSGIGSDYGAIAACHRSFLRLIQCLQCLPGPFDLTVVTREAQPGTPGDRRGNLAAAGLPALGTLAANECPSLRFRSVDWQGSDVREAAEAVWREIALGTRGEVACAEGGRRYVKRLKRSNLPEAEEATVDEPVDRPVALHADPGQRLGGLGFRRAARREPGAGEVELRVEAASLNYKDYLKAVGRLNQIATRDTYFEEAIGLECVGEVLRIGPGVSSPAVGDRVTGFVREAFRSYAVAEAGLLAPAPAGSGPEAAGIATVYLSAVHGLERIAGLRRGERVLIHQASGGVGRAAIEVARARGAEIYATAGSEEKRAFVRSLGVEHVFDSRSLAFGDGIRAATGGEGVDVVLGAVSGPAQHESLDLLRAGGRYIELGKRDIVENTGLPLRAFNRNLVFASVDIDRLILERPAMIRSLLEETVARIEKGELRLPEGTVFPAREIGEAFQLMAQSRHTGKILIDFRGGEVPVPATDRRPGEIRADGAYLVTGGTSGFGLETARWLAREGAGRVVLLSRRGRDAEGMDEALALLQDEQTEVVVEAGDVADPEALARVEAALRAGGLRPSGIVHAAMVLDDALLPDQNDERFDRVLGPKVDGLLALCEALPCAEMDFVALYSSVSSLIGNRGQANYVAANALLDALAHDLRGRGVPALSINWGALAETGVVARSGDLGGVLESAGVRGLGNQEALAYLRRALRSDLPQVAAFAVDWERWGESHPALGEDLRFLEHLEGAAAGEDDPVLAELRAELADKGPEERLAGVEERLGAGLSAVLKLPADRIKPDSRLSEMGVDSLLLLELSLELKGRTGVTISAMEFLKGPSLRELAGIVLERAGLRE